MANYAKPSTNLLDSPGSPAPIAASADATSTAFATGSTTGSTTLTGGLLATVIIGGSAPTTNPTIQWQYSLDGTNYANDDRYGTIVVPMVTGTYNYSYQPPLYAIAALAVITNGATNGITAWVQGATLGVS
jgi:hypothetical protein